MAGLSIVDIRPRRAEFCENFGPNREPDSAYGSRKVKLRVRRISPSPGGEIIQYVQNFLFHGPRPQKILCQRFLPRMLTESARILNPGFLVVSGDGFQARLHHGLFHYITTIRNQRSKQDRVAELHRSGGRNCQAVHIRRARKIRKEGRRTTALFEQMKREAAGRRFDRLWVWKVSRLGRDMREVVSTVYELADLGVTVIPVKSLTGPITSTMGRLLWAIQAWCAEMENDERSESIRAGHARARAGGKQIGRPRRIFDRQQVVTLRAQEKLSWPEIALKPGVEVGTVRRAYDALARRQTPDKPVELATFAVQAQSGELPGTVGL